MQLPAAPRRVVERAGDLDPVVANLHTPARGRCILADWGGTPRSYLDPRALAGRHEIQPRVPRCTRSHEDRRTADTLVSRQLERLIDLALEHVVASPITRGPSP